MARAKKTETTPTTGDKTEAVAKKSEPVIEKPVAAKKAAATKKAVEAEVKNEIVVVAADMTDSASQDTALSSEFTLVLAQVQTLAQQFSSLRASLRALEKKASRELKVANKASKKNKRAKSNRQPSGFVKPTQISVELATFLGKAKGVEMARTEVTKEINSYIRANSLQDPKNGRRIIPDAKLVSLLSLKSGDELTYFNLQKFMSPHFAKASAATATANVAAKV